MSHDARTVPHLLSISLRVCMRDGLPDENRQKQKRQPVLLPVGRQRLFSRTLHALNTFPSPSPSLSPFEESPRALASGFPGNPKDSPCTVVLPILRCLALAACPPGTATDLTLSLELSPTWFLHIRPNRSVSSTSNWPLWPLASRSQIRLCPSLL